MMAKWPYAAAAEPAALLPCGAPTGRRAAPLGAGPHTVSGAARRAVSSWAWKAQALCKTRNCMFKAFMPAGSGCWFTHAEAAMRTKYQSQSEVPQTSQGERCGRQGGQMCAACVHGGPLPCSGLPAIRR